MEFCTFSAEHFKFIPWLKQSKNVYDYNYALKYKKKYCMLSFKKILDMSDVLVKHTRIFITTGLHSRY